MKSIMTNHWVQLPVFAGMLTVTLSSGALLAQSAPSPAESAGTVAHPLSPTPPAVQNAPASPEARQTALAPPTAQDTPATPAETAPAAAPEPPPPGYVRIEDDYLSGLQIYSGVTYPIQGTIGLAAGIYLAENYPSLSGASADTAPSITQSWWSEFDIGPSITLGPLSLTLEGGIAFDFAAKRALALNAPQLYTTLDIDKIHFESWLWTILYSPFDTPNNDYVHTRNWLLYKLSGAFALGPELDFNVNLNGKYGKSGLVSLPIGGRVDLTFGANTIALFVGYQTDKDSRGPGNQAAVGRFGLIHNF